MRRVLLTDSMPDVADGLSYAIGDHFQLQVCSDGKQLQELLESFEPEILLLDLSMPGYDQEQLLRQLQKQKLPIIVSALGAGDYLVRLLDGLGVAWLMVKPLFPDGVVARLLELELVLDGAQDRALRNAVYTQLLQMGVRLRYSGFMQLAEAVCYACTHKEYSLTEQLYPGVAQACGGTAASAEKSISRCIEQAFARRRRFIWNSVFGNSDREKRPTNSHFISHVAHAVNKQLHR